MSIKTLTKIAAVAWLLTGIAQTAGAQKPVNKMWEESSARMIAPEVRMFVTPQICDMRMLSTHRESYGPYAMDVRLFNAKSFSDVTNGNLRNMQTNALYLASKESDADAVIEPIYHTWVNDNDDKTVYIEISGYPVSYVNFRPAQKEDLDMIGIVYKTNSSLVVNTQGDTPTDTK